MYLISSDVIHWKEMCPSLHECTLTNELFELFIDFSQTQDIDMSACVRFLLFFKNQHIIKS